jgi:dihydroorotate dehydrogenase (fumarate)
MILKTRYLGFDLPHPFILGASPLVDDLDTVRRAEDAGAAAIVMHSVFEEQIKHKSPSALDMPRTSAVNYVPGPDEFKLTPDGYLEQLRHIKSAVAVPVIASMNGVNDDDWLHYASCCAQAGADAIELNLYQISTDPDEPAASVENRIVDVVRAVKSITRLPIALKLSPFFTSLAHFARQLDDAGADGFVLFNRFYQPDIDPEALDMRYRLELSSESELPLRLRWLAILSPLVRASLAVSGGVHNGGSAVKALMAGAHAVQVVSEVLRHGPDRFRGLIGELVGWMDLHDYHSVSQIQGNMNLERCADPSVYERANYINVLNSWEAKTSPR